MDWNNRITTYAYDNNGRLIEEGRPNGTIQTYTYNNAGQLIYTVDGKIINEYSCEYDADGNIITEDSLNEPNYDNITISSSEINYGSANQLTDFNGTAISYDKDGNMLNTPLGDKWGALTYNSRNLLTEVTTSDGAIAVYGYDAENNRTLKTEYGKTTYYIYGLGLITQENADGYKAYHYDYRGSTTAITDGNGNVTDRIYYGPYGNVISRMGTAETPFPYAGKYGIGANANGLYYIRIRYYNPTIKKFISVDPIKDGYNWYIYSNALGWLKYRIIPIPKKKNLPNIHMIRAEISKLFRALRAIQRNQPKQQRKPFPKVLMYGVIPQEETPMISSPFRQTTGVHSRYLWRLNLNKSL